MVDGTEGDREFVALLKAEASRLRVANMMRMRWCPTADGWRATNLK
jgi:hypothetical protein